MEKTQDFKTHVRWHPPFHFVLAPLMLINLIYSIVRLVQDPGWDRGEFVLLSVALVILTLLTRNYPLKAQDRIIRLEERLRLATILGPEAAPKAMNLKPAQYIALRFASDEELPELVSKIEDGELTTQNEIKTAITNWRPDHFRV
ncbi:MAG: DUF6526 family protein [Acidobacteriota bacterium]|nr:DUF6526 family protein [Acidobacteriota bacterium]MDH3530134.1 DUF6526 family protein [Acidobacteriota bacterium]